MATWEGYDKTGEQMGFMKVPVGAHDDRILAFTMIDAEVGLRRKPRRRRICPTRGCAMR
jgi:hypothetical protein